MTDTISKTCPKIKEMNELVQEKMLEVLGISYEIENLLKLGQDFYEFNLGSDEIDALYTLFQVAKDKEYKLSQKLDEYSLGLIKL